MTAPRWRIVSDGTPSGTTVHLGDVDVSSSVAAVAFRLHADDVAEVVVRLTGQDVDVDVDVDELTALTVPVDAPAAVEPRPEPIECPPNRFIVGARGDAIVQSIPAAVMTPTEAAEHAAWLSVMAESLDPSVDFDALRAAVRSS